MEEYIELKKYEFLDLLKDAKPINKLGLRKITQRAIALNNYSPISPEISAEQMLMIELAEELEDLESAHLTQLLNYIQEAKLPKETIFNSYLDYLQQNFDSFEIMKAAEITRFLLELKPAQVPMNLITEKLNRLKIDQPWLYADLISRKNLKKGVNFIRFLIEDDNFDSGYFTALFSKWCYEMPKEDIDFIFRSLKPLIKKQSVLTIMEHEAKQAGLDPIAASSGSEFLNQLAGVINRLDAISKREVLENVNFPRKNDSRPSTKTESMKLSNNESFKGFKQRSKRQELELVEPPYAAI